MRGYVANKYGSLLLEDGMSENLQRGAQSLLETAGVSPERAEAVAPFAAIIPEMLPAIGESVGIDNTIRAAREGNYGEAALEGVLTGVGAVPVLGDLAKYAIIAGLGARGANTQGAQAALKQYNKDFPAGSEMFKHDPEYADASTMRQMEASAQAGNSRQPWFVGPEGMPRFEINDSGASLNRRLTRGAQQLLHDRVLDGEELTGKVGAVLNHKPLMNAYPFVADMPLTFLPKETIGSTAAYMPPVPELVAEYPQFKHGGIALAVEDMVKGDREELISSILHEVQHGVQNYEGFGAGASASMSPQDFVKRAENFGAEPAKIKRMKEMVKEAEEMDAEFGGTDYQDSLSRLFYKINSGEAESRAVEIRRRMSAADRKLRPPSMDYRSWYTEAPDAMSMFDFVEMQ